MPGPVRFWGTIVAVKPRLILAKFDGETDARCQGYVLFVDGTTTIGTSAPTRGVSRVAIGPATLLQKSLRVGNLVRGDSHPVPESVVDVVADLYRVGVLHVIAPGTPPEPDPPRTDAVGTVERIESSGRRALAPGNLEAGGPCERCPHGLIVCTVLLNDPRDFKRGEWHRVAACLGPTDCPHYAKPGATGGAGS
jgi:hypothetical protein